MEETFQSIFSLFGWKYPEKFLLHSNRLLFRTPDYILKIFKTLINYILKTLILKFRIYLYFLSLLEKRELFFLRDNVRLKSVDERSWIIATSIIKNTKTWNNWWLSLWRKNLLKFFQLNRLKIFETSLLHSDDWPLFQAETLPHRR